MEIKHKYFSTFVNGTKDVVEQNIKKYITDIKVTLVLDGLIEYETTMTPAQIEKIRFFNNSFVLIKRFDNLRDDVFKPMIQWVARHGVGDLDKFIKGSKGRTFRVITNKENKIVAYNKFRVQNLERDLVKAANLRIDRHKPDMEFWFLARSEGYGLEGLRITNNSKLEHRLKGQIRPEIANLLCLIAEPKTSDVVLDPFAGYGTIPLECSYYPHNKIAAYENNEETYKTLKQELIGSNVEVFHNDFFESKMEEHSVDKIITDPPWGIHEKIELPKFYEQMFKEFRRILKPNGVAVILTSQKDLLRECAIRSGFAIAEEYGVLISGQKAAIYKLSIS